MRVDWETLLQIKEKPATQENFPLLVAVNKTLSNIKNVIDKHWHILFIHTKNLEILLIKNCSMSIDEIKHLHQMIEGNCILKSKVVQTIRKMFTMYLTVEKSLL